MCNYQVLQDNTANVGGGVDGVTDGTVVSTFLVGTW